MKHIVNVTISNPAHDFVSMRSRQSTTNYMVEAKNEAEAILRASKHFKSLGHYVHNAVIVEQNLNEEVEQIDELKKSTLASYATKAARNIRTSHSLAGGFDDDHTAAIRKVLKNSPNVNPHKGHIRSPAEKAQGELEMKVTADLRDKFKRRAQNRITGIGRAVAKLAKEEADKMPVAPVPGDKWKSHAVMVHPETKQRVVVARKNAKNYPESDGWKEVAPGMKLKKKTNEEVDQIDETGIMKKVGRSLAGWGAFDKDKPKDVVKNTRSMSNDALSQIAIPRKNTLRSSPAALQQKVAKRELAKRNIGEEVKQIDEVISAKERKWREAVIDRHGDTVRFKKKRHEDAKTYHTVAFKGDNDKYVGNFVHSGKMAGGGVMFPARSGAGGKWTEVSEEVKQIDELKKSTLGKYIKKSAEDKADRQSYDDYPDYSRDSEDNERRLNSRTKGISKAVDKLAKEEVVNEKAPPGAKYERMVKHIKSKYSEDGTLTDKEKAIAYATAWKAKNSGK